MPAKQSQSSITEILFPVGGLVRNTGFQHQPPYSTPYCLNVRPYDTLETRLRGGARPGLVKSHTERIETGPIQLLLPAAALSSAGVVTNMLLTASAGKLYRSASGSMTAVVSELNPTAKQLSATQIGTKVYIADFRPVNVTGKNGTIASNNRLSDTDVTVDWTTLGIDTDLDVVWISGEVDSESNIFPITSLTENYIVLDTGGQTITNQVGGVIWQLGRIAKVFDTESPAELTPLMEILPIPRSNYSTGTVTIVNGWAILTGGSWADAPQYVTPVTPITLTIPNVNGIGTRSYAAQSIDRVAGHIQLKNATSDADVTDSTYEISWPSDYYGIPPLNCNLACTYRGRLVLAGPNGDWFMSKVLDPRNWDYGDNPNDPSRAVSGPASITGGVPDPITALIPHSDSYLLFGCHSSLWMLTADPAYGGSIKALSREIGVLGNTAWCGLPDGSTIFLSRDGLYQISTGGDFYPQSISRPALPEELVDVNSANSYISLWYDVQARGVHISITPHTGAAGVHYFLDWTNKTFWPVTLPNAMQPTAMARFAPAASDAAPVILAGFDGYLRKFSAAATNDDGTAFVALVAIGPLRVGGAGYYGEINHFIADIDINGDDVYWAIIPGDTAQEAIATIKTMAEAGTLSAAPWCGLLEAGEIYKQYPRAMAPALAFVLYGGAGWAIEGLSVDGRKRGPI